MEGSCEVPLEPLPFSPLRVPPEGPTCPCEDQSQVPRPRRWHLCLCVGEMPPAASTSSTSCSAKNTFSAAEGSSFRSPSRKPAVQQPASWRLGRLGVFFLLFSVQLKGKAGWGFSSFFKKTLLCQGSCLVLQGKEYHHHCF